MRGSKYPYFKQKNNNMEVQKLETQLVICDCHSDEHQIIFHPDDEDGEPVIYMHTHLTNWTPWYKRLIHGIKYIFGHTSKYGEWDEIILTKKHAKQFRDMAKHLDDDTVY